ncbi:hypothetical protein ABIE18_000108 [Arthrobacter sp. 2762]
MDDKFDHTSAREWPPPGHAFTWTTEMNLDGFEPFQYELTVSDVDQMDMSNAIYGRIGGPAPADIELRKKLYYLVGAITVASGHIEAAMKRVILTLQENRTRQFSLVDKTWTDLHKILVKELKKEDGGPQLRKVREELSKHIQWAERRGLKTHRDDFVHGSICDFAMPAIILSRFHRKQDGTQILYRMEQIEVIAENLQEYAARLESLLHGIWHEAMLPANPQVPGYSAFTRPQGSD